MEDKKETKETEEGADVIAEREKDRTPEAIQAQKEAEEDEKKENEKDGGELISKTQREWEMLNRQGKRKIIFSKKHAGGLAIRNEKRALKRRRRSKISRITKQQQRRRKCA